MHQCLASSSLSQWRKPVMQRVHFANARVLIVFTKRSDFSPLLMMCGSLLFDDVAEGGASSHTTFPDTGADTVSPYETSFVNDSEEKRTTPASLPAEFLPDNVTVKTSSHTSHLNSATRTGPRRNHHGPRLLQYLRASSAPSLTHPPPPRPPESTPIAMLRCMPHYRFVPRATWR